MTDRTQPDSASTTGSTHIIRYALELGLLWIDGDGRDKVREALDALDALEAKLDAVSAGGVQALSASPPSMYVDGAGIHAEDGASAVIRKLDARFHDIVTFKAVDAAAASPTPQALSAAPAGWKLVPEDATEEMVRATDKVNFANADTDGTMHNVWNVMLAATPTPPAEQQAAKETSGGFHVWRDISTAPKDGSRFVATGHNYGLYSEVRHTCVAQWFRGCWMEASDWNETSELKYLTHWMPLPPLPGNAARKQGANHD